MANWLAKASSVLSRDTPDEPQPFQLTCECGTNHQGQRKSRAQRIICQTCGTALFVLPRNVYPELKPPKPKRKRRSEDELDDAPPARERQRSRRARGGTKETVQAIGSGVRGVITSMINAITSRIAVLITVLFTWVRSLITPFRMVIAGVLLMLLTTGVWTLRTRGLDQARETLRVEFTAGEEALKTDDLELAYTHFANAAAAADHLNLTDARGQASRQMAHETEALIRLAPASLIEMLEEGETIIEQQSPEAWVPYFNGKFQGTWLVLQAPVRTDDEAEQSSSLVVEMPILIGEAGHPVSMTVTNADATALGFHSEPQVAWFAASLGDCVFDQAHEIWEVTLDGSSCFLWTDLDNLKRLGFFENDPVAEQEADEQLNEQSRFLGMTP
ncbi:MAG: hypothetical protein R3C02_24155 [Planctomycetaceae bacterium]